MIHEMDANVSHTATTTCTNPASITPNVNYHHTLNSNMLSTRRAFTNTPYARRPLVTIDPESAKKMCPVKHKSTAVATPREMPQNNNDNLVQGGDDDKKWRPW